MSVNCPSLSIIAHDSTFLSTTPQLKGVVEVVTFDRIDVEGFLSFSRFGFRLLKPKLGEVPEC